MTGPTTAEAAFHGLLGRPPSVEERLRLQALREQLGIDANDAIWLLFVAFEYYRSLYQQVPESIRAAAMEILIEHKTHTDATLEAAVHLLHATAEQLQGHLSEAARAAAAEAQTHLAATFTRSARRVARQVRLEQHWPWLLGGGLAIAVSFAVALAVGVGFGRATGYAEGHAAGYAAGWREAPLPRDSRPALPRSPGLL